MPEKLYSGTAEQQVIAKTLSDPQFRQSLLSNPKQALSQEFGVEFPAEVDVRVLEEKPEQLILVIPTVIEPTGGAPAPAPRRPAPGPSTICSWSRSGCCKGW
jgi:hypothetical protein